MIPAAINRYNCMTRQGSPLPAVFNWHPRLDRKAGGSKQKSLTEAIIGDIEAGVLQPELRMPTHRDLALSLGLSVQTVSLAYKEAERLGYLRGEVGRGTFVRARVTENADRFMLDRAPGEVADLSIVRAVYTEDHEAASRSVMASLAQSDNSLFMRPCRPIAGLDAHRTAAAAWLRPLGVDVPADRVVMTNGAAHGIFLALAAVVRPGDLVLTENLTDHGVIGLANVLGFTLRGIATDEQGVTPEAFEAACAGASVRALVVVPTLGNPTSHVAGAGRRRALAEVARRHGVFVIEDEVYKPLLGESLPAVTDLLPDLGFFVTSMTKTVMTGLRVGYLVVPPQYSIRVASIVRVTTWSATYLPAEIATRWIEDGTAAALLDIQRREAAARQAIVRETLAGFIASTHPLSLCVWLKVPQPWEEGALVRALAQSRIAVTPSDPFVAGDSREGGIRICLGGRLSHQALRETLASLRRTLEQMPPVFDIRSIA
jgi:DNA-binding transcriptional MocR family regulator